VNGADCPAEARAGNGENPETVQEKPVSLSYESL
jgi:hypothetical protein